MVELNLTATDVQEEKVLAYLKENASDMLADKINNGTPFEKDGHPLTNKKTLSGFMKYACDEAQKLAAKGAGSACVNDDTVYGWAIHYFEEDSIEGTLYTLDGTEYKPAPTVKKTTPKSANKPKSQPSKQESFQFSLFDNLTQNDVNVTKKDSLSVESEEKETVPEVKVNPLWSRYQGYQAEHPNAVVAMRVGDVYEVFGDYARKIADIADLTLTGRDCGLESRVPMVGFPYHVAKKYFDKILEHYDLYIVENESDKRFVEKSEPYDDQIIDEDTGEIFDLTEEEMRLFDGDIDETVCDTNEDESTLMRTLNNIFGSALEVK